MVLMLTASRSSALLEGQRMRRFNVIRKKDISGISGTGLVAEGVEFHDNQVCVSWFGKHQIVEVSKDLDTWKAVHGHGGSTVLEFIDNDLKIGL
jgi:hypothetical protein